MKPFMNHLLSSAEMRRGSPGTTRAILDDVDEITEDSTVFDRTLLALLMIHSTHHLASTMPLLRATSNQDDVQFNREMT